MIAMPTNIRVVSFVDGQNLFYAVKDAFGYEYPNFNPILLSNSICSMNGWNSPKVRFYTGHPSARDNSFWHTFWTRKSNALRRSGVYCYLRTLVYRHSPREINSGELAKVLVGFEKGIDVRIALDLVRLARKNEFDVALIFSQDQDLSEAALEIKEISKEQDRWIKIVSAYPENRTKRKQRGIDQTMWFPFDKSIYDDCIDKRDFR